MNGAQRQGEHARRAEVAYGAAADHYTRPALAFWDRWGSATIARVRPLPGAQVVDVCCGAGASALAAAQVVGPSGSVLGIDLAEPLLALARQRARQLGLTNTVFERRDATASGLEAESFDAVVCVFGVFFAADMTRFVSELWALVRPGGSLAITTGGPDWCEPDSSIFWSAIGRYAPTLHRAFNPWDTITTETALRDLFASAGVDNQLSVHATSGENHELARPEDFWDIVLGSGYRATVDALSEQHREAVRIDVCTEVTRRNITSLRNDVVIGIARKSMAREAR